MVRLVALAFICALSAAAAHVYQDPSASVADRAVDLLSLLNNTEKKVIYFVFFQLKTCRLSLQMQHSGSLPNGYTHQQQQRPTQKPFEAALTNAMPT